MVGPNKILTVSYGTFSCTLEGFDDPFSTMKAIAEYFRDLASEDRFFGAEPPTPDVQMLHAIAQSSSDKPVDAEVGEHGLRLTQGNDDTHESEADAPASVEMPSEEPVEAAIPDVSSAPVSAELAMADTDEAYVSDTVEGLEETTEASTFATEAAEETPSATEWELEDDFEDAHSDYIVADAESDESVLLEPVEATEAVEELSYEDDVEPDTTGHVPSFSDAIRRDLDDAEPADEDIAALFQVEETAIADTTDTLEAAADAMPEPEVFQPALDEPAPEEDLATSGIASKLQRIRSVVAASVSGLSGQKQDTEEDLSGTDDLTDESAFGFVAEAEEPVAEHAEYDEDQPKAPDDDALEEQLFEEPATAEPETSFEDELAAIENDEDLAPRRGVALELSDEDLIAAAALARPRNAPRPKAFERTVEAEQDQPFFEEEAEGATAPEVLKDEEAALLSDLASIESELAQADAEAEAVAEAEAETAAEIAAEEAAEARRARAQESLGEEAAGNNDETVERLLSQTNSKLEDDHTQRRQSALAHLKAAVAATIADRVAPNDGEGAENEDAAVDDYRKDLASIVRPRAVEDSAEPKDEPEASRDAEIEPLVLVPQARVEPDGPVRPRRVNRSEKTDALEEQSSGFADYADEMGAHELHELLEAAAAYLSTVEGKTHFSRPEVMHMVMRHDRDRAFSREAQLRSFGDLLRNGTIEKVDRGQFVISNDSRFVGHG